MDQLSAEFTKESMNRLIDECQDIEEVRRLAKLLLSSFLAAKQMIGSLLLSK